MQFASARNAIQFSAFQVIGLGKSRIPYFKRIKRRSTEPDEEAKNVGKWQSEQR